MTDRTPESKAWEKWGFDYFGYAKSVLKVTPSDQQKQLLVEFNRIMQAKWNVNLAKQNPRIEHLITDEERLLSRKLGVSVMSGKGVGKDADCAWLMHAHMNLWSPCKILATAPKFDQLGDILWSEFSYWNSRTKKNGQPYYPLHDQFVIQSDKIFHKGIDKKVHFAVGRTAADASGGDATGAGLQGYHSELLLVIIEEASGVGEITFQNCVQTMTQPLNMMVIIFNPNRTSGFAYDSHFGALKDSFVQLHWNSEDSPNVSQQSIDAKRRMYWKAWPEGSPSNEYRVSVWGLPPESDEGALIPHHKIHDAVMRYDTMETPPDYPLVMGVDPAGGGSNKTMTCSRIGGRLESLDECSGVALHEITTSVMKVMHDKDPDATSIEEDGIGGFLADDITRHMPFMRITKEAMGGSPINKEKFVNRRAELWWAVKEAFENNKIAIPDDAELIEELKAFEYSLNTKGKIVIISKRDIKKKLPGNRSPDKADALMNSYAIDDEYLWDTIVMSKKDKYEEDEDDDSPGSWMGR